MKEKDRYVVLKKYTNDETTISELLEYTRNKFLSNGKKTSCEYSIGNESYIDAWERYHSSSKAFGVFETLKSVLVQFQFPIQKGISLTKEYRNATLKGVPVAEKSLTNGLELMNPQSLQLQIHECIAGKVPVLIVPNSHDFCRVVQALFYKNEPVTIPKSMGAILINGINNWDRIYTLKKEWQAVHPTGNWSKQFREHIVPQTDLYKDKIIVLSTKPYSNVAGSYLDISDKDWIHYSIQIRLAHECAHLFTLKYYGHMASNIHDEIIADYTGIVHALGKFNKNWFLHFMGLENYPQYRVGGRLENYLGNNSLTTEAFNCLKTIIFNVATNLLKFDELLGFIKNPEDQLNRVKSICELDVITLSSLNGSKLLIDYYNTLR